MPKKFSKQDLIHRLSIESPNITLVGEFVNTHTKTLFRCLCGNLWEAKPNDIRNRNGCRQCAVKSMAKTDDDMKEWLVSDGRGYTLIGKYTNAQTRTTFQCSHGHSWVTTPNFIKNGRGCPTCERLDRKNTRKDQINSFLKRENVGISIIGNFTDVLSKTLFECVQGHNWEALPSNIIRGTGCPHCAEYGFNPNKPAWEYGFTRDGYLKYGITNDLIGRLDKHRRYGEIVLVHERYHEIGQMALDWENYIKRTYGGRYATKEQCPDGYTETLHIDLLESIRRHENDHLVLV